MGAVGAREDEAASIAALAALDVLDTAPEAMFDALVQAAASVCGTSVSLISLIDSERQWFKANHGLPGLTETPRDIAFCAHAVLGEDLFEVPDAAIDPRFSANPLVVDDPSIRFYAGVPIQLADGHRIGTLCVIDQAPRSLTEPQRATLRLLARAASQALEWRKATRVVQRHDEIQRATALALSKSEQIYRGIVQNLPNGAVLLLDRSLRYVATDGPALDSLLSYFSVTSLIGKSAIDLASDATRDEVHSLYARVFAGERVTVEIKRGDHYYDVSMAPIYEDERPTLALVFLYDVTRRKTELAALQRSEDFLDRTGRLAGVGGWQLDLETQQLTWSDETCRIHGVEPGYVPRLEEAIEFYAPESREPIRAAVERSMQDGTPWDLELALVRADQRRIWVRTVGGAELVAGKAVRLAGAFQNITEQIRQRSALSDMNDRISVATDSGAIGIWDFNLATNETHWDPWMFRLYGMPEAASVSYETWRDSLPPASLAAIRNAVVQAVAGGSPFDLEFDIVWPDGSVHYLRSAARVMRDAAGKATHLVGANWDVTKRKLELDELHAARIALEEHANELRSLSVTDELTGLLNRRGFLLVAEPDLKLAARNRQKRVIVFFDLNGMKQINDTLGHKLGDVALVETAKILRKVFRDSDVVARLGGDEFVVLVSGADVATEKIHDRVRQALMEFNAGGAPFRLSLSVGTSTYDGANPAPLDQLLVQADARMYEQKRARTPSMRIKPPST